MIKIGTSYINWNFFFGFVYTDKTLKLILFPMNLKRYASNGLELKTSKSLFRNEAQKTISFHDIVYKLFGCISITSF